MSDVQAATCRTRHTARGRLLMLLLLHDEPAVQESESIQGLHVECEKDMMTGAQRYARCQ